MEELNYQKLIGRYLAAYNSFDIEGILALLAPHIRFENYSGDELTASTNGIDEFRQLAEKSKFFFSEREQRLTDLKISVNSATATIAYRGKLAVDVPNGPAAGTVINLQGKSEYFFVGDKFSQIIDRG